MAFDPTTAKLAFDPASAKPVGFDPSTAKPVEFDPTTAEEETASWGDTLGAIPEQVRGGAAQAVGGMMQAAAAPPQSDPLNKFLPGPLRAAAELPTLYKKAAHAVAGEENVQELGKLGADIHEFGTGKIDVATPDNQTFWQKAVSTAGVSAGTMVPAGLAAYITKQPGLLAGSFGVQEFGRAFGDAKSKGLDDIQAARHATASGLLEAGTEYLPAKVLFKAGTGAFKRLVNFMARELPGENIAELGQMVSERINGLDDEITAQQVLDTVLLTSAATMIGGAGQTLAAEGLDRLTKAPQASEPAAPEQAQPEPAGPTLEDIAAAEGADLDAMVEEFLTAPDVEAFNEEVAASESAETDQNIPENIPEVNGMLDRRQTERPEADRRDPKRPILEKLTPEERDIMLRSDVIPSLPSKRAFELHMEENPGQPVMFLDYDDFKTINDKRGEKETDRAILAPSGEIMEEVRQNFPDVRVFHRSGDEFLITGADESRMQEYKTALRERLKTAKFEAILPDGTTDILEGVEFSDGIGQDEETSRAAAKRAKAERKAAGLRSGVRDTVVDGQTPAGNEVQAGQVAFDPTTAEPINEQQETGPQAEAPQAAAESKPVLNPAQTGTQPSVDPVIKKLQAKAMEMAVATAEKFGVNKSVIQGVYLVGSRARGAARKKSDIDILVKTKPEDINDSAVVDFEEALQSELDKLQELVEVDGEQVKVDYFVSPEFDNANILHANLTEPEGVSRETFDPSTAQPEPVAKTPQTDSPEFKKWFGSSKVVDESGKPLVVYHGTDNDFTVFDEGKLGAKGAKPASIGFWFSDDQDYSKVHGDKVMPAYLSMRRPYVVKSADELQKLGADKARVESLKKQGYDGVMVPASEEKLGKQTVRNAAIYAVFNPSQIKSTGNRGTFDPNDPNILHANPISAVYKGVKSAVQKLKDKISPPDDYSVGFKDWAPPNSMLGFISDNFLSFAGFGQRARAARRRLQDKFIVWRDVQEQIDKRGGKLDDFSDAYNKFTMVEGKIGNRLRKVYDNYIAPIIKDLHQFNVTIEQLDEYLYAKFAPERNKHIASINKDLPDGGSGMTDAEAKAILAKFTPEQTRHLERIAQKVYSMQKHKLDILVDAGRMTKETRDELLKDKRYVPLKGFAAAGDLVTDTAGTGRGFDQAQDVFKRAKGRKSLAADILATSLRDVEAGIIAAEKNRVGQAILKMVLANPNQKVWKPHPIKIQRAFNSRTGQVEQRVVADYKALARDPNVFVTWVGGKPIAIEFKDTQGPGGESSLARAVKNMGVDTVPWWLKYFAGLNRWMSYVNTALNPEFLFSNPVRDIQTAMAKTFGDYDAKIAGKVFKNIPRALKAAIGGIAETKAINQKIDPKLKQYYEDYAAEGGKTDYFRTKSVQDMMKELESELAAASKGAKGAAIRSIRFTSKVIENSNAILENTLRVSAYITLREAGYSSHQAAKAAKNLTVNFNRKGEAGPLINALYLFYNAATQGAHLTLKLMKNPKIQKLMVAAGAGVAALTQYNILMGGDDDDGEPNYFKNVPDYEKQRNLIIMWPDGSGRYVKIPLAYGLNVPLNLAAAMVHAANGRDPLKEALWVASSAWNSYSPISEEGWNLIAPTALDPFVDISLNRNYAGRKLMPDVNPFDETPPPDSQRAFPNTNPGYRKVAETLNSLTTGNEQKPGYIDVSPESIQHLVETYTGGAGGFANRMTEWMMSDDMEASRTPFLRKVYGEKSPYTDRDRYEQHKDHIYYLEERSEYLREKARNGNELEKKEYLQFKKDNQEGLSLVPKLKQAEGKISGKYKQRKHLEKDSEKNKDKIEKSEVDVRKEYIKFNTLYNEIFLDRGIMEPDKGRTGGSPLLDTIHLQSEPQTELRQG